MTPSLLLLAASVPFVAGCHAWNERFLCVEGRLPDAARASVEAWLPWSSDVMAYPGTRWETLIAGPMQYAAPVPPDHVEPVLAAGREGGLVDYPLPRPVAPEDVFAGRQAHFRGNADADGNWRVVYVRTVKSALSVIPFVWSSFDEANPAHALVIRIGRPEEPERAVVLLLVVRKKTPESGEVWRFDATEPTLWRRAGTVEQVEVLPGGNRWTVRLSE